MRIPTRARCQTVAERGSLICSERYIVLFQCISFRYLQPIPSNMCLGKIFDSASQKLALVFIERSLDSSYVFLTPYSLLLVWLQIRNCRAGPAPLPFSHILDHIASGILGHRQVTYERQALLYHDETFRRRMGYIDPQP